MASSTKESDGRRPLVLFAMAHAGFVRNFRDVLLGLCDRGVDVHIILSKAHEHISLEDYDLSTGRAGRLTTEIAETHHLNPNLRAEQVRILRDVLQYCRPEYRGATDLKARFPELQKKDVLSRGAIKAAQHTCRLLGARPGGIFERFLKRVERSIPPNEKVQRIVDRLRPDVVVVTPLINFASREVDFLKAAHRHGIPTVLPVASWDNLTNKGVMKVLPDHVLVWNDIMRDEAERFHGVNPSQIRLAGAAVFDNWFDRRPSVDRADFCAQMDFDPDLPIIAYMCSSSAIAGNAEPKLVTKWARKVRGFFAQQGQRVNILVRPHPMHRIPWIKFLRLPDNRKADVPHVYPLEPVHPSKEESQAIFFDTLYHCSAVVGLNTSTMIEAAILRKPVLTFLKHPMASSQAGNLHFRHLLQDGMLLQAKTIEDHLSQLDQALRSPEDIERRCDRFVSSFVRPLGLSVPASAVICDEILDIMDIKPGHAVFRPSVDGSKRERRHAEMKGN